MNFRVRFLLVFLLMSFVCGTAFPQTSDWLGALPQPHNCTLKRVSSYDRFGGNADFRSIPPEKTLTLLS
jgi:hypothetical protein